MLLLIAILCAFCTIAHSAVVDLGALSELQIVEYTPGVYVFTSAVTPPVTVWPESEPWYPYSVLIPDFSYQVGIMPDKSDGGFNGDILGGCLWNGSDAYDFDGTDGRVRYGALSFGNGTSDSNITWSGWVFIPSGNNFCLFSKGSVPTFEYRLRVETDGTVVVDQWDNGTSAYIRKQTDSAIDFNQWQLVTITSTNTGDGSRFTIYTNGVMAAATKSSNGSYVAMDLAAALGNIGYDSITGSGDKYADGQMRELRVYARVLSSSEVAALYAAGRTNATRTTIDDTDLVLYYPMNFDYTTVADSSYVGTNTLTVSATGATWVSATNGVSAHYALNGTSGYLKRDEANWNSGATSGWISVWVKPATVTSAGSRNIFSSCDEGSTVRYLQLIANSAGDYSFQQRNNDTTDTLTFGAVAAGVWTKVKLQSNGSKFFAWINGVSNAVAVAGGSNNGGWFGDTIGRDNIYVGARKLGSTIGTYWEGSIDAVTVANYIGTDDDELDQYYHEALDYGYPSYLLDTTAYRPTALWTNAYGLWTFADATFASGLVQGYSANGNHLTPVSTTPTTINGTNGAATFNGINSKCTLVVSDWNGAASSGSVNAWVNLSSNTADQCIISTGDSAAATRYWAFKITQDGYPVVWQRNADTADQLRGATKVFGGWHMVTLVSSGSAYFIYVDGIVQGLTVLSGSNTGDWHADTTSQDFLVVGILRLATIDYNPAKGDMDEIAEFNTVISSNTVYQLYQDTKGLFGL